MSDPLGAAASGAAAAAIAVACERLVRELGELVAAVDRAAATAVADWTGPHRETFDHRAVALRIVLLDAADALAAIGRRAAASIATG